MTTGKRGKPKTIVPTLGRRLEALRPQIASAAREVVEAWAPNEEGEDEEYGYGGACDAVARAMEDVIYRAIPNARIREGGQEGDDHAYLVVYDDREAYEVDVPPGVYETGGGYSWRKRPDATVTPRDVVVHAIPRSWIEHEDEEGYAEAEAIGLVAVGVVGLAAAPAMNGRIAARPLGPRVPPSLGAALVAGVSGLALRRAGYQRAARGAAAIGAGLVVGTLLTARRPGGLLANGTP